MVSTPSISRIVPPTHSPVLSYMVPLSGEDTSHSSGWMDEQW
jgi:hypothetical protein